MTVGLFPTSLSFPFPHSYPGVHIHQHAQMPQDLAGGTTLTPVTVTPSIMTMLFFWIGQIQRVRSMSWWSSSLSLLLLLRTRNFTPELCWPPEPLELWNAMWLSILTRGGRILLLRISTVNCLLPGFPRGFLLIRRLLSIYSTVYILLMSPIFNLVEGNDLFLIYECWGHSWALIHSKIVREGP